MMTVQVEEEVYMEAKKEGPKHEIEVQVVGRQMKQSMKQGYFI